MVGGNATPAVLQEHRSPYLLALDSGRILKLPPGQVGRSIRLKGNKTLLDVVLHLDRGRAILVKGKGHLSQVIGGVKASVRIVFGLEQDLVQRHVDGAKPLFKILFAFRCFLFLVNQERGMRIDPGAQTFGREGHHHGVERV